MQREQDDRLGTGGDVRLVVPAAPEYLRLVRLTAAGLASRMGFTFDEVEDLRIAVDELCFLLVGNGSTPQSSSMELRYSAGPDSITIEGRADVGGTPPEPSELSLQILGALVDEHEVDGDGTTVHFRLLKRREEV
ncbi:MAG TPA: ATP-binding protein [Acidimicrobiia bacterium]|nr:ATP-binding protein [Acidimicrobiia bacterium]